MVGTPTYGAFKTHSRPWSAMVGIGACPARSARIFLTDFGDFKKKSFWVGNFSCG
jgi:hypothetical protein